MPFVSTHIIKLPNIYWAFAATFILEMKEQRINNPGTWSGNVVSEQRLSPTWYKADRSDAGLRPQPNQYCLFIHVSLCTGLTRTSYFLTAILLTRCVPSFNTAYSWKIDSFLFESNSWFCIKKTLSGNLPPSFWFCKCNSEKQPLYALSEPKHQERLKIIITYIYTCSAEPPRALQMSALPRKHILRRDISLFTDRLSEESWDVPVIARKTEKLLP